MNRVKKLIASLALALGITATSCGVAHAAPIPAGPYDITAKAYCQTGKPYPDRVVFQYDVKVARGASADGTLTVTNVSADGKPRVIRVYFGAVGTLPVADPAKPVTWTLTGNGVTLTKSTTGRCA